MVTTGVVSATVGPPPSLRRQWGGGEGKANRQAEDKATAESRPPSPTLPSSETPGAQSRPARLGASLAASSSLLLLLGSLLAGKGEKKETCQRGAC